MSIDPADAAAEQWLLDHAFEAIEASLNNTLRSRYVSEKRLAVPAFKALTEARDLAKGHPAASIVLSVTAIEQAVKKVFLEPLVHGLIHEFAQDFAPLIAQKTIGHRGWGQFQKILFDALVEYGGINMDSHARPGVKETLWKEALTLRDARDMIVHRAEVDADQAIADQAIAVASELLEVLFPRLVRRLNSDSWHSLHVDDDLRICSDRSCPNRLIT